ncbi:MAG: UvrD-helicase domain-containing protein [Coriobacteriia bacterium]|nr:UvrD-helicase domain-containing protein [Coriobacteriia bacterium]
MANANKAQQAVIDTFGQAMQVSAGAGTGKTFTLVKKLIRAFEKDEHGQSPLDAPKEILAITFTKKAAAELAQRVRRSLKKAGYDEISRQIDSAWISTIDSMCTRILRENALQAGIDPEFTLMDEQDRQAYSEHIARNIIDDVRKNPSSPIQIELLDIYKQSDLITIISSLSENLYTLGIKDIQNEIIHGPNTLSSGEIGHKLLDNYLAAQGLIGLQSQTYVTCENGIQVLQNLHKDFTGNELQDYKLIIKTISPFMMRKAGKAKPFIEETYILLAEAYAGIRRLYTQEIFNLIIKHHEEMDRNSEELSEFTFSQIAQKTYLLLLEHQDIAQNYRDQFKLIMVDEFQDTNQLQVNIIKQLCAPDLSNLLTVGDAQQAIYGFRGADVQVYLQHQREVKERGGVSVSLDENFRSHEDILDAVQGIFIQEDMFGDEFLKLKAARNEEEVTQKFSDDYQRIQLLDAVNPETDITELNAKNIARKLKELQAEQGISPGEMAIILEQLSTKDKVYLNALRQEGFDVVLHGGSAYYSSKEILILINVIKFFMNPKDDIALVSLLTSELFTVDESELLVQALQEDAPSKFLYDRLTYNIDSDSQLGQALAILQKARAYALKYELDTSLLYLIEASGFSYDLLAQGEEGKARYANILKFIEIVHTLNLEGIHGIDSMFQRILALQSDHEPPATLESKDAIKIMTIHASKGLEFPLVAVGNISNGFQSDKEAIKFMLYEGSYYLVPKLGTKQIAEFLDVKDALGSKLDSMIETISFQSYAEYLLSFNNLQSARNKLEKYRKYYVAFTRARESLLMASSYKTRSSAHGMRNSILTGLSEDDSLAFLEDKEAKEQVVLENKILDPKTNQDKTISALFEFMEDDLEEEDIQQDEDYRQTPSDVNRGVSLLKDKQLKSNPNTTLKLSYSTLAPELKKEAKVSDSEQEYLSLNPEITPRANALDFGTMFHRLMELSALFRNEYLANPQKFIEEKIKLIVAQSEQTELEELILHTYMQWQKSEDHEILKSSKLLHPEAPFEFSMLIPGETEEKTFIGFIDLVAHDDMSKAYILDYKTGYHSLDSKQAQETFELQGVIYAYAALLAGFSEVELHFVRVEVGKSTRYLYHEDDKALLQAKIIAAYKDHVLEKGELELSVQ